MRDKGQDVAAREGAGPLTAREPSCCDGGPNARGEAGLGRGGAYLVKSVISRLEIPRKFSTFALTSSAKPPATKHRRRWSEGPLEEREAGPCTTARAWWQAK